MSAGYPYPIVPPLPEHERRTEDTDASVSRTESERKLTPEQIDAQERQDTLLHTQTLLSDQERAQRQREVDAGADIAKQQADQAASVEKQRQAALDASQKSIDEHRQRIEAAQAKLDATPSPKFFQDGETWHNAMRAAGAGLAGVGDALVTGAALRAGHGPPSIDTVSTIIERDLNSQRERIARLKDNVVMAHTGLADANQARQQMLSDVDLKAASAYDRLAKIGAARLAALKQSTPDIEQNKEILALIGKREEARQKALEPLHQTIEKHFEPAKHSEGQTFRDAAADAAAKSRPAGSEDVVHVNQLDNDVKKIDAMMGVLKAHPEAWDEVRDNDLKWRQREGLRGSTLGKVGQGVGLVNVAPEQGLSTAEAKLVHQGNSQVTMGLAKGYGGVVTEHDVENSKSEQANMALSAQEKLAQLSALRDRLVANRENFIRNRHVADPDASPATPATPPPTTPAPASATSPSAPTQPPPFAPPATSPPPRPVAPPVAPTAPARAEKPDKSSGKSDMSPQIRAAQDWLKSPAAKAAGAEKVRAVIRKLRELQGG